MKKVLFISATCADAAALVYRARGTWSVRLFDAAAGLAQHLLSHRYDCVFVDVARAGADGFALLAEAAGVPAHPPLFVLSRETAPLFAVKAVDLGALDYFTFPCDVDAIDARVSPVCAQAGRFPLNREDPLPFPLIGSSEAMRSVRDLVRRYAPLGDPVLVTGETGTGKELVSRNLHALSARAAGPFVAVNMGEIPQSLASATLLGSSRGAFTDARDARGVFERAHGGTLFMDEVAELDSGAQAALLRVLDDGIVRPLGGESERAVDARVVSATGCDLSEATRSGRFRLDLLHRLDALRIEIPPLRDRVEDIAELAGWGLRDSGKVLSGQAIRVLSSRRWPGNVRQLIHCLRRASLASDRPVIRSEHLPS
jgi:DNA-binding NtrC family response regulator